MARLNKLEGLVKGILIESPETRDNDDILYMTIVDAYGLGDIPISSFLRCRRIYSVPSYESAGRCRRKIQADNPELRGNRQAQEFRTIEEAKFKAYALNEGE